MRSSILLILAICLCHAEETKLVIHAAQTEQTIPRFLTGSCIEDVNHEIYGGLYSQMIFGESFQEPPTAAPIKNFSVYGGRWTIHNGELSGDAGPGPKIISDHPAFSEG